MQVKLNHTNSNSLLSGQLNSILERNLFLQPKTPNQTTQIKYNFPSSQNSNSNIYNKRCYDINNTNQKENQLPAQQMNKNCISNNQYQIDQIGSKQSISIPYSINYQNNILIDKNKYLKNSSNQSIQNSHLKQSIHYSNHQKQTSIHSIHQTTQDQQYKPFNNNQQQNQLANQLYQPKTPFLSYQQSIEHSRKNSIDKISYILKNDSEQIQQNEKSTGLLRKVRAENQPQIKLNQKHSINIVNSKVEKEKEIKIENLNKLYYQQITSCENVKQQNTEQIVNIPEYKNLYIKLGELESKILNIKSNIQSSREKVKQQNIQQIKPNSSRTYNQQQSLSEMISQIKNQNKIHLRKKTKQSKLKHNYLIDTLFNNSNIPSIQEFVQTSIQSVQYSYNSKSDFQQIQNKKISLPYTNNKTLVLDLDETLIHCNLNSNQADVRIPVTFPNGDIIQANINIRPNCKEFLEKISQHFEVIVFTASHSCYANVVLDYLDPENRYISYRLFRESCIQQDEVYFKDLRVLGNRELKNIVIVDNAVYSFQFQILNGIPIIPFFDSKDDQELDYLLEYLMELENCEDIREFNKEKLKLQKWGKVLNIEQLMNLFE